MIVLWGQRGEKRRGPQRRLAAGSRAGGGAGGAGTKHMGPCVLWWAG